MVRREIPAGAVVVGVVVGVDGSDRGLAGVRFAAGEARRTGVPHGRVDVPEIGFEPATARALRSLADKLQSIGDEDVADVSD